MVNRKEINEYIAYVALCIAWGSTYLAIGVGVLNISPFLFMGIRHLTAGSVLLVVSKIFKKKFPCLKIAIKYALVGCFLIFGGTSLVAVAQKRLASGMTAIVLATIPLWMVIVESFYMRKRILNKYGWFGLVLGFLGVGLMTFNGINKSGIHGLSILFVVLAAISWSVGSVYNRTIKYRGFVFINIGIQLFFGGAMQLIVGIFDQKGEIIILSKGLILSLVYLIFVGTLVGYSSFVYLLGKWPIAKVGTYAYVNPVVALILGVVILNEPVTKMLLSTSVMILVGVVIVQYQKRNVLHK